MKKALLLSLMLFAAIITKAAGEVSVTFSTDFTEADLSLFVPGGSESEILAYLNTKGVYLVYGKTENFGSGTNVQLTRSGETLIYSSEPVSLDKNTLYEYYFQIGSDGYAAEGLFDDIARLAPGYYRFFHTGNDTESITLETITFDSEAPAGKKLLRVKLDLSGTNVSDNGVYTVSGNTVTRLVNVDIALGQSDRHIYEGLIYAETGAELTFTFYNGSVPTNLLIDDNTYTVHLQENIEGNLIEFSTTDVYEAVNHDLYDPRYIQRIEMQFEEEDWADILTYYKDLGDDNFYLRSQWVKINGVTLAGVGVRYKGNSSYTSGQVKNPFNISLDEFVSSNNYKNFTSLKLANVFGDPSFVREVVSYQILNQYIESGKCNFAQVYVNGQYLGLYSNTEAVNKSFCTRHFGSKNNPFIECSPSVAPTVKTKSNLKFISEDENDYLESYELKVGTWSDLIALCKAVTENSPQLENVVDIDKFLWYLAFNNILVNIDSYVGVYSQNYYVYRSAEGRYMVIPWDLNMSFGGFNNIGVGDRLLLLNTTQRQQLALDAHSTDNYWPMINNIFNNETWRKMYLAHCKTIFEEYFKNDTYLQLCHQWQEIAERSVAADKNKFYSLDDFKNSLTSDYAVNGYTINGIQTFIDARKTYLSGLEVFTIIQPSFSGRSHDYSTNQPVVTIQVNDANAEKVFIHYRVKGDANNAFTSVSMTKTDNVFTVTLPNSTESIEYYFYAENEKAAAFLPARAAYTFYTMNVGDIYTVIEQIKVSQINIYPNPTSDVITVTGCTDNDVITVYNLMGRVVYKTTAIGNQSIIPVKNWANGIYLLKSGKNSCKFVVNK